jgi:3D (Asp-Asp-Asp) domain-containing protein/peptidoglycan hydrolase CwlO-like protein
MRSGGYGESRNEPDEEYERLTSSQDRAMLAADSHCRRTGGGPVRHEHSTLTGGTDDRKPLSKAKNCTNLTPSPLLQSQASTVVRFRGVGERHIALSGGLVLVLLAALAALQLPAASGAESPSRLQEQAESLRAQNGSLSAQEQATWLSVISLDTRLEQSRAALVRLRARTRTVARERAEANLRLQIARRALRISEQRLALRLRALYQEGDTDPLTVVLGAGSISEAIEGLESLDRAAGQDKEFVQKAKTARKNLVNLTRVLAGREAEARRAEEATAATAAALAQARGERAAALVRLRAEQQSNSAQASSLDAQARSLAASARPTLPAAPVAGGKVISVTATGYALPGTTATGVPVGWGVVAVDPSFIPLGTSMTIPGYGEGVAADTGGAVVGAHIDLWFPTRAEALAWGTRTVTITLH